MRVIFSERGRITAPLLPLMEAYWPGEEIILVSLWFPYFSGGYDFPRTLRYQDLPLVATPQYKYRTFGPETGAQPPTVWMKGNTGELERREIVVFNDFVSLLSRASSVVYCDIMDYQPITTFELFLEHFMPHLRKSGHKVISIDQRRPAKQTDAQKWQMEAHLDKTTKDSEYQALAQDGLVKKYFDYNFHLNANVIFGDLYRKLSGTESPVFFTKYMIMIMFVIRELPASRMKLETVMYKWKGGDDSDRCSIGTIISRQTILTHLIDLGLIKEYRRQIVLTDLGNDFLSKLHKDCYDPHLPRRLMDWRDSNLERVKPIIDRYLKTYFGKQIRFQSELFQE